MRHFLLMFTRNAYLCAVKKSTSNAAASSGRSKTKPRVPWRHPIDRHHFASTSLRFSLCHNNLYLYFLFHQRDLLSQRIETQSTARPRGSVALIYLHIWRRNGYY